MTYPTPKINRWRAFSLLAVAFFFQQALWVLGAIALLAEPRSPVPTD